MLCWIPIIAYIADIGSINIMFFLVLGMYKMFYSAVEIDFNYASKFVAPNPNEMY